VLAPVHRRGAPSLQLQPGVHAVQVCNPSRLWSAGHAPHSRPCLIICTDSTSSLDTKRIRPLSLLSLRYHLMSVQTAPHPLISAYTLCFCCPCNTISYSQTRKRHLITQALSPLESRRAQACRPDIPRKCAGGSSPCALVTG